MGLGEVLKVRYSTALRRYGRGRSILYTLQQATAYKEAIQVVLRKLGLIIPMDHGGVKRGYTLLLADHPANPELERRRR